MAFYQIGSRRLRSEDPSLAEILAGIHRTKTRPLCLCRDGGVEMYVAKVHGKFVIKRMPDTGSTHSPACDSYEPPAELSGLGQVSGSAIQENPDEGTTALKLDFSLTKVPGRSAPPAGDGEGGSSVRTDGNKLTLRGTLHYLWEEAGFHRWAPSMTGKRNWYVIRKYLLQAASDKTAKGADLADILFIPETFSPDKAAEIGQRRVAQVGRIAAPAKGTRRLMLVIGEVKEIAPSRYGHKIVLKHLPDWHFMLNDDIHKRLQKRFETELGLWDALDGTRLVMIGTFGVGSTGVATLEEAALMAVTENWIPFESLYDKMVLDALTTGQRRYAKGLRYNLQASRPLACAVVTDTAPEPTALYIHPPGAGEEYLAAAKSLMADSRLAPWVWDAGSGEMPALPARPQS